MTLFTNSFHPGILHLMGTLKSLSRGLNSLDFSHTGVSARCLGKVGETIAQSETLLSSLQTLKLADNSSQKHEDIGVRNPLLSMLVFFIDNNIFF